MREEEFTYPIEIIEDIPAGRMAFIDPHTLHLRLADAEDHKTNPKLCVFLSRSHTAGETIEAVLHFELDTGN